jgi:DNA polymerase
MSFITLDFETFYSDQVGFKRQTNEEYLRDPQFEVVGVSVKVNDTPAVWFSGDKAATKKFLDQFDWKNAALLAHNTMFDGAILAWHFDIVPAMYFDTLCMARAIHGVDAGGSLAKLAERYDLGEKGTEVINAMGKKRLDFDADGLARYGEYCINDTELTYKLFNILATHFPRSEFDLIDMTLRMYTQPVLRVNDAMLVDRLNDIREEKSKLLQGLIFKLECATEEEVAKKLGSNPQFAQVLRDLGVVPPMKISPTTGKETYAFAKTDDGFIALQEHEDSFIQQLCAVRLGTKSTIEESRIERFIEIGSRNRGHLPVPLKYYGAHTGRWSGMDMVNFQNLPSRDKRKKALKNAIVAPDDHYIINCDSSQIEARVLAWLAGQDDVTEAFAKKRDVYCEFATKAFGRTITKANEMERFVGKTCVLGLGYGTGAKKLQQTLSLGGAELDEAECKRIVDLYRREGDKITGLWGECDRALVHLASWPDEGKVYPIGYSSAVWATPSGIRLPNGLYIKYPELRMLNGKYVYNSRKGIVNIWGGTMVENIVQALARIIVGEQMLAINKKYRVILTVHDAAVLAVPKNEIDAALKFVTDTMSTAPSWCADLPVACEAKYSETYGGC